MLLQSHNEKYLSDFSLYVGLKKVDNLVKYCSCLLIIPRVTKLNGGAMGTLFIDHNAYYNSSLAQFAPMTIKLDGPTFKMSIRLLPMSSMMIAEFRSP